jgi:hypothetical protein
MKIYMILLGLVICGCASQPTELTQEEKDLHVFYEEPKIDYEDLGGIDATSRANTAMAVLDKILSRASGTGCRRSNSSLHQQQRNSRWWA